MAGGDRSGEGEDGNGHIEEATAMTPQAAELAAMVDRRQWVKRNNHRLNSVMRSVTSMVLIALFLVLVLAESSWPAEKLVPTIFKTTEEAVGWLKARGKCEGSGGVVSCEAEIHLPAKGRDGKGISPGWRVEGFWKVIEATGYRNLFAHIVRSRIFSLSPTDSLASVFVQNASVHDFGSDGIVYESRSKVWMTNHKGENILSLAIPWTQNTIPTDTAIEDFFLLREAFGVGWKFIKSP